MLKKILFIFSLILAFFIIKQSLTLRYFHYALYPELNLDEYTYIWQALSLKKTGIPTAWTINSGEYQNPKYRPEIGKLEGFSINSLNLSEFKTKSVPYSAVKEIDCSKGPEQILFVAPFFDHPPIGGLIYQLGLPSNINQVDQVKPQDFRRSAINLAIITTVLLFILLYLLFQNPWVPLLSTVIYSTVPTYILATRTTYLENAVAPIALLGLIFLYLGISCFQKKSRPFLIYFLFVLSGLLSGLSVLTKEPAIGFALGFFILLIIKKIPKNFIFAFIISVALPVLAYIAWGLWLQKDLFLGIFLNNANRSYFGAIKAVTQLEALKFKNFPVDGWWIWGFISFLFISFKNKNKKILFITLPLLTHLLTVFFMPSPNYPWYLVSSIPFLAASSAVFIWQIIKKPTWASALSFFFIPFSSSYYWGRTALNLLPDISHYRYIFFVFFILLFIRLKLFRFKTIRFIWFVFFALLIYRIYIYNQLTFPYLMGHWGSLPIPSLPNY